MDYVRVFGMVNGTLLEVSFQEGPCSGGLVGGSEGWVERSGWDWKHGTPGVEVIQQFNREETKTWGLLPPVQPVPANQGNYMFSGRGCPRSCSISLAGRGNCSSSSS